MSMHRKIEKLREAIKEESDKLHVIYTELRDMTSHLDIPETEIPEMMALRKLFEAL